MPTIRSWDDWFAAAEASGLTGEAWLTHWWDDLLPDLARRRVVWKGPTQVPHRPWDVSRWGESPRRRHGLINWDRRSPHTWQEALAWGLLDHEPGDFALRKGSFPPVNHPMGKPHRRARQWYRRGLRFSGDDVAFWLHRMLESGNRFEDRPTAGGCPDVSWCYQMGQVESPLRAAVEIGRVGLDGINANVATWWALFEDPSKGGFRNAPYLLTYLLRQGFNGAEQWRQRLLAGTSTWDSVDSTVLYAFGRAAPLDTLARPWSAETSGGDTCWTFAHACVGHFQREVKHYEVIFPVDVWWQTLHFLHQRHAPLFHSARRPGDGAWVTPWEEARRQAEDPEGFTQRALNGQQLNVLHPNQVDPAIHKAVLQSIHHLREQEVQALRDLVKQEVGPLPVRAHRPRL